MPLSISSSEPLAERQRAGLLSVLIATLVTAVLILAVATEWLVRSHVLPQDTLALHLSLLDKADSPDAAFGDSHVARGFDAQDGFINLAYPSENIEYIFYKVQRYYADKAPARVILQADPHLFAPYRMGAAFTPYVTTPSAWFYSATDRHRPRLWAYWVAYFKGAGRMVSKVTQTTSGALLSQGDLSALPARRQQYEAIDRVGIHALGRDAAVTAAQARYAEMMSLLGDKGAQVCLVSFPVSPAYLAALETVGPTAGHADAVAFFADVAATHGATYVDARAFVSDAGLFRDVDHLNVAGANGFAAPLLNACFTSG